MSGLFSRSGGGSQPPLRQPPHQQGAYGRVSQNQGYSDREPPQQGYGRGAGYEQRGGYRDEKPPPQYGRVTAPNSRTPISGRDSTGGQTWQLRPAKAPQHFIFANNVAVSPQDFPAQLGKDFYVMINDLYVLTAKPEQGFPPGQLSLNDDQRTWMQVSLQDVMNVRVYNHVTDGSGAYIASVDVDVSFRSKKQTAEPFDQDELGAAMVQAYENQVLAPGQRILMDFKSIPLLFMVKSVRLQDLSMDQKATGETLTLPNVRAILFNGSEVGFFKSASSTINLKASKRRPAANAILQPNFKFEDMGIGGLDKEFGDIFRRAFASRLFPPGLVEEMGIQYVKGILLYGPPGTGKTLIARKIGQMLNAREPKVINGPEVLNKYVGQSEENIRKLFADAEKEYKEKGEESGLHIIIFDELDAVCKQRGSGTGGGTGVGDSVVNQLLSKLDGVDQLNNILLIGMTNRKDMIDDALLRPGRLEVHMEIPLPDEKGRLQIFNIHTAQLRKHNRLAADVNIVELAHQAKNFSGAEIGGVIRSAVSMVAARNINPGSMADMSGFDIDNVVVTQSDFLHAVDEITPAFGVAEDTLGECLIKGIIHYSPFIANILEQGQTTVKQAQSGDLSALFSAVLHGPQGSGKTALAARIALDSGFPFIKLCSANDMFGFNESMKIEHMRRLFDDAYKSPLSVIVLDGLERIIGWRDDGPRFQNAVVETLEVILTKRPPKGRRLLILATTSRQSVLDRLGLFQMFNADIAVPAVGSYDELLHILQSQRSFRDPEGAVSELQQATNKAKVNVGVKQILYKMEAAEEHPEDMNGNFVQELAPLMAKASFTG